MFKSKYIFETRQTRIYRYLKSASFVLFICFLSYLLSGYFFILWSKNENSRSREAFFKRPPDLIVVFTGDSGRIPYAIAKAKAFQQSHIFITGVYGKNSVQTLINPLKIQGKIDPDLLEIDYLARNTVENVISTLRYLRQNNGFKQILVISHDYHILRIKSIFTNIISINDDYRVYFEGIDTDYTNWRNIKKLYKEVYKFFRTWVFLQIWDHQSD
jgi:uncharacterized SAM-binding protein YcdF (DUF218 family)